QGRHLPEPHAGGRDRDLALVRRHRGADTTRFASALGAHLLEPLQRAAATHLAPVPGRPAPVAPMAPGRVARRRGAGAVGAVGGRPVRPVRDRPAAARRLRTAGGRGRHVRAPGGLVAHLAGGTGAWGGGGGGPTG